MVTNGVNARQAQGFTLIEVLLANSLGILLILAASFAVMAVQKPITKRSEQLLVMQNMSDALRYIKLDLKKAGFNSLKGTPLTLMGSNQIIITTPTSIEYAYQKNGIFTQTHFKLDGKALDICTNQSDRLQKMNACDSHYFSLMDERQVQVNRFHVEKQVINVDPEVSVITIALSASLVDGRYPQSLELKVSQRN